MSVSPMMNRNLAGTLTAILAGVAALFAALAFFSRGGSASDDWEARVKRAAELQNNKLYAAAAEEFAPLVENPAIPAEKRANYAFTIGQIYQDELHDYENAAAYFVRARTLGPRPGLDHDIGQRLVECFENLGRSFDAARQLADYTAPDTKSKAAPGDVIVAKIGERQITLSEVEHELQKLPVALQGEFTTSEKKKDFVKQYIGMELLYASAVRRGRDRQPELLQQYADVKKQLVLDGLLKTEIIDKITVTDADLDLFYRAHSKDLFGDKPFNEVRSQVEQQYRQMKQREKYAEMIDKLITAEQVTIYEDRLK